MSKKRKTRKQKEQAKIRQPNVAVPENISVPSYSVKNIEVKKSSTKQTGYEKIIDNANILYLRRDLISISAATGIVVAFNILLFTLLVNGVKLNFLGY